MANRMASSPPPHPCRRSSRLTATRHRLTSLVSSPPSPHRRRPGQESALRLCQSSRNRGLLPNSWITLCLTVTLVTAPQTPSLMPKSTQMTLACHWSPPMAALFTTPQPAATRLCSNWNSLLRSSRPRCGPAAVCRSLLVMWLLIGRKCLHREEGCRDGTDWRSDGVFYLWASFLSPELMVGP